MRKRAKAPRDLRDWLEPNGAVTALDPSNIPMELCLRTVGEMLMEAEGVPLMAGLEARSLAHRRRLRRCRYTPSFPSSR
jgi:hypothetical protein